MPSPLRDPKALSEWFELDYFKRRRAFRRLWKFVPILSILASVVVLIWLALPVNRTVLQAGPVSTAHALFNQDCQQCHTNGFQTLQRFAFFDGGGHSVPDSACLRCHAGPPHQHMQLESRACASCHREHRGHAVLARVEDNHCTGCHKDLKAEGGRESAFARHITGFAPGQHPEFRLWEAPHDPGTIRFNHQVHLAPEGVFEIDSAQQSMAISEEGPIRKRVQLQCNACHQLDATGRYMQPIRYENHCQQCHPLQVRLEGTGKNPDTLALLGRFGGSPLPHPSPTETPETVRATLRERLSRFIFANADNPALFSTKRQPAPEALLVDPRRADPLTKDQWQWVNQQLAHTERQLFDGAGGCRYCHKEQTDLAKRPEGLPVFERSAIPSRWLSHGTFNHQSHRMLRCEECHSGATTSAVSQDVLLPRSKVCQECHKPASVAHSGQARSDCVECHRYHNPGSTDNFRGDLTIRLGAKP